MINKLIFFLTVSSTTSVGTILNQKPQLNATANLANIRSPGKFLFSIVLRYYIFDNTK